MRNPIIAASTALAIFGLATATWYAEAQAARKPDPKSVERGRYLVQVAGCNDCHTPGYIMAEGRVPEKDWLIGERLGWRGPWGTTYAVNLRLALNDLSEEQWLLKAKVGQFRPPMPWFNLHAMTEDDLRAIYHFVRALGPAGEPAPAYVPPDKEPAGPAVLFPAPPK